MRFWPFCAYALIASCIVSVSTAAAPASTQPVAVRASTIDGSSIEGRWSGISESGELRIQTAASGRASIRRDEVMLVRFGEPPASQPAVSDRPVFYLADGSRFSGQIVSGGSKQLVVQSVASGELTVPFAQLAGLRFGDLDTPEAADLFAGALSARSTSEDLLITIREGRVTPVRGVIDQITPQGGSFRWRERNVPFQWDMTYALVLARGVQPVAAARALCSLKDGTVWGGDPLVSDERTLQLKSGLGKVLNLPVADLREIRFRSDRVVLLSELQPLEYHFEPFAVTQWPYRYDRSVANLPLRIGGHTFERGIGMHSQSRLVYEPADGFTQLAATIGIDDSVRPRGNVVFRVVAEGKEVFNSGPVSGSDSPKPILVPLSKPKRIELHVDFGEGLDISDHADWGQVRLIR